MHLWLVPGDKINNLIALSIPNTQQSVQRLNKYEQPLDKVIECCNLMKAEA